MKQTRHILPILLMSLGVTTPYAHAQPPSPGQAVGHQRMSTREQENSVLVKRIQQRQTYATPEIARERLRANPNDAEAHRTLAMYLGTQPGKFQEEMRERREAIRCNPDNPYDIIELASMERPNQQAEAHRLLTGIANGHYDAYARQIARRILFGQAAPYPGPSQDH